MFEHLEFSWPDARELARYAANDELWQHYLNTKVLIELTDGSGTVWPSNSTTGQPSLRPLHVATAVQPDSDPGDSDNVSRMKLLDRELRGDEPVARTRGRQ